MFIPNKKYMALMFMETTGQATDEKPESDIIDAIRVKYGDCILLAEPKEPSNNKLNML